MRMTTTSKLIFDEIFFHLSSIWFQGIMSIVKVYRSFSAHFILKLPFFQKTKRKYNFIFLAFLQNHFERWSCQECHNIFSTWAETQGHQGPRALHVSPSCLLVASQLLFLLIGQVQVPNPIPKNATTLKKRS